MESDEEINGAGSGKGSWWLKFGASVTAIYALAFLVLGLSPAIEAGPLTFNELGDLLAGAFAPLAFLWLLVAVMVQAQELRLQRNELQLTRREFAETREVAKAQAAEARKQAEFIGRQTEILTDSAEQARRLRGADTAKAMLRLLHTRWYSETKGAPSFSEGDPYATLTWIRRDLARYETGISNAPGRALIGQRLLRMVTFAEALQGLVLDVDTATKVSLTNSPLDSLVEVARAVLAEIEAADGGKPDAI